MKKKTYERVARIFISSLLNSDLKSSEMREISDALLTDDDFSRYLGTLLSGVVQNMADYASNKKPTPSTYQIGSNDDLVAEAIEIISKKRITKKKVAWMIGELSPKDGEYYETRFENYTLKKMLEQFFHKHDSATFLEFIYLLQDGNGIQDEYLKGIMRDV